MFLQSKFNRKKIEPRKKCTIKKTELVNWWIASSTAFLYNNIFDAKFYVNDLYIFMINENQVQQQQQLQQQQQKNQQIILIYLFNIFDMSITNSAKTINLPHSHNIFFFSHCKLQWFKTKTAQQN